MLKRFSDLKNFVLQARDGEIGRCKDFLYDDRDWSIRFMVADTHKWLPGRKVIVTTGVLGNPGWDQRRLPVELTREKLKHQPPVEDDPPLVHQIAQEGWIKDKMPYYWVGPGGIGLDLSASGAASAHQDGSSRDPEARHLRSMEELQGYRIEAKDGRIGHVDDLLLDTDGWNVRFVVVDTRNWLPGRKVIVSPRWAVNVDFGDRSLVVSLSREAIRSSPRYDPDKDLSRVDEAVLFNFYGLTPYWKDREKG